MNKKIIISSSVLIVIMIIFFMERADLKEAGISIYLLGIFEVFYLIFMMFFSLRKKLWRMLVMSSLYMSLTLIMITWREPFLMFLTHQSSSVEESKHLDAYVCSYSLSKKKMSLGKDSVIIAKVFLEREHSWNSYNQNYMVYEPTYDCRVIWGDTGGRGFFLEKKVFKCGEIFQYDSRTVSAKDTLLLIIGKEDYESRKVMMADTVYCFPYEEK